MRWVLASSCLLLLTQAIGGGVPAEDAAVLLQRQAAPLASAQQGTLDVESLRSVLAVAQADLAKRSVEGRNTSKGEGQGDVALSTIQTRLRETTKFLADKLAKANATSHKATKASGPGCRGWCTAAIILDSLALAAQTNQYVNGKTDQLCAMPLLIEWWVTGVFTLMEDQQLDIGEAVHVLSQLFTSVGYGTSGAPLNSTGLKMFHGLHGVLSQLAVNRVIGAAAGDMLNFLGETPFKVVQTLTLALAASTFYFAADLHDGKPVKYPKYMDALLDGLYQSLTTATTGAYGDIALTSKWGKLISPVTLPLLAGAFGRLAGGLQLDSGSDLSAKEQLCTCFGQSICK